MRTTLDLPEALLDEAQRLLGFTSKTDTVVLSLTELIRRRRIDELKALMGKVDLVVDLEASRRRPAKVGPVARARSKARSRSSS
jgi:Arc/MetJ family transcription regulator